MLKRIFGKKKIEERQRSPYQEQVAGLAHTQLSTVSFRDAESYVPTVIACVDLITNSLSSLPVRVVSKDATDKEVVARHPLVSVLADPYPGLLYGVSDVIRITARSLLAYGNAVILIGGDESSMTLEPIPWIYCGIVNLSADNLVYQVTRPYRGKAKTYPASRIIHLKLASDDGGFYGQSPLQRAGASVALVKLIEQATASHWRNACYPSLCLSTTKTLSPTAKKQAREDLVTEFAGGNNQSRPLLVDQDIKVTALPINAQHQQWLEQRQHNVVSICQAFGGIVPILVGDLRFGTYSNFAESLRHYHELTLQPLVTLYEQALTHQLLSDDPDLRIELDTSHLRVSRNDKIKNTIELVKAGILTTEEAKKELGYG